jgi:hypothetical protein
VFLKQSVGTKTIVLNFFNNQCIIRYSKVKMNRVMFLELNFDKFGAEDTQCSCSARKKKPVAATTFVKQSSYWQADCRLDGQETKIISEALFPTKKKKRARVWTIKSQRNRLFAHELLYDSLERNTFTANSLSLDPFSFYWETFPLVYALCRLREAYRILKLIWKMYPANTIVHWLKKVILLSILPNNFSNLITYKNFKKKF